MMTARMMMLNCVHETSVGAAVVLSVGLLRLVSRAWVVVVLRAVLVLLLGLEAGMPLDVVEIKVVLVDDEDGLGVGASAGSTAIGLSRDAEERKTLKRSLNGQS